jgi:hypothetical protein
MTTRKKTKILLYLLLPTGTYCKSMMILDIIPLEYVEFGFILSCIGQNHFFQVQIWQNFTKKEKTKQNFISRYGLEMKNISKFRALNNP